MPRRARPHWDKREQCYRTEVGGKIRYFRGLAREDHAGLAAAFSAHLAALAESVHPAEPDAFDVCSKFNEASRGVEARTTRSHRERLNKFCIWPLERIGPGELAKLLLSDHPPDILGNRRARDLKASHLRAALRDWESKGLSGHYRAGICRSVKAAFRWAASEEGGRLIPSNPFEEVRGPDVERSPERYAARKEVADFLRFAWRRVGASDVAIARHAAGKAWREGMGLPSGNPVASVGDHHRRFGRLLALMIRVGARTGTRPGDLCCAWWEDFDRRKAAITLPPDRHKTGKKTGRPLIIFLGRALASAIAREKDRPGRHPVSIFTHMRGKGSVGRGVSRDAGEPWGKFATLNGKATFIDDTTPLSQAIRKIRIKAVEWQEERRAEAIARGIPEQVAPKVTIANHGDNRFVFYRLRHTVASDFLMKDGATATVAALLGTSPRMLETTYGHMLEDHLAIASEKLRSRRPKAAAPDQD